MCRVNGGIGGMEKGSMVALKRVNGALVRVRGGIEKGQGGHWSGSMGVLKRVNGVNGGIEKDQWGY